MKKKAFPVSVSRQTIENQIRILRGQRVMLDTDLAELYGVSTKALNQAVRRNRPRFPNDFAFQLTPQESDFMRSQDVTALKRNIRYRPFAFTEHGALMPANVLNSSRAIAVSIFVVRTFVRLRQEVSSRREFLEKLLELEQKVGLHDKEIKAIFEAVRQLMYPPESSEMVSSADWE